MKVGVYTIALNEEQFVERWVDSAKDADYLLIADTGSTDSTIEKAKQLGVNVIEIRVKPWRFDDARNVSLANLPDDLDYCIALDMDEVLLPGWRKELEKALNAGATRPRYKYTWSWKDEAHKVPGLQYGGDKIHSRSGYRWRHPVHEVISTYGGHVEKQYWIDLEIHHHPDSSKPRSQYLPLLKQAVEESPNDDRNAFYYARELYFYSKFSEAALEFKRHLSLPSAIWPPERAASMRYLAKIDSQNKEDWLLKAITEAPGRREALVELSLHYYETSDWEKCYDYAIQAISVKEKPLEYLCEDFAWSELPWDLAAYSAFRINKPEEAVKYNNKAMSLNPEDKRLKNNSFYYQQALDNKN